MRGTMKRTQTMGVRLLLLIGSLMIRNCVFCRSVELPCKFLDTVNITEGHKVNNESILFEGIEYPNGQYAEFDYIENNETDHTSVEPHIRGCLCNRKPCMRICCPLGTVSGKTNGRDVCRPNDAATELEGDFLDGDNHMIHVKYNQVLSIVDHKPCDEVDLVEGDYRITYVSATC